MQLINTAAMKTIIQANLLEGLEKFLPFCTLQTILQLAKIESIDRKKTAIVLCGC